MHHTELDTLLEGCRRNHRASQHRLYSRYYNYAMSVASRYARGLEVAEEVVNDSFFKVFTKIHQFAPGEEAGFRAWLRRIVINTAIDRLRVLMNQPLVQEWDPIAHDAGWDEGLVETLTQEQVFGLLDRLPPAYRAAFNLCVVDGYTHEEAAELLGISVGASKSNLSRARGHLRTLLSDEFELTRRT